MFKASELRFWIANRLYHLSQIGRAISDSLLYHQSWMIDCQISCFWSYNWSYPLTIGRATSRRTTLSLNMQVYVRLGLTGCTICADSCTTQREVLLSYDYSHDFSCHWLQQVAKTNRCMRSKFCISPNIHDRVVCTSNRQKSHDQKIIRYGVTEALDSKLYSSSITAKIKHCLICLSLFYSECVNNPDDSAWKLLGILFIYLFFILFIQPPHGGEDLHIHTRKTYKFIKRGVKVQLLKDALASAPRSMA